MESGEKKTAVVKTDCEVCKRLIREKHRYDILWRLACLLFALLAVVFAVLYFTDGGMTETTTVNMDAAQIETNGESNEIIIGGEHYEITGTATADNDTVVICLTVVASVAVLLIGGALIAVSQKNT